MDQAYAIHERRTWMHAHQGECVQSEGEHLNANADVVPFGACLLSKQNEVLLVPQLFYKSGRLRVVVPTANFIDYDWRDIENVSTTHASYLLPVTESGMPDGLGARRTATLARSICRPAQEQSRQRFPHHHG